MSREFKHGKDERELFANKECCYDDQWNELEKLTDIAYVANDDQKRGTYRGHLPITLRLTIQYKA